MTTGLTPSTFERLQLNAGVLLKNFDRTSITNKASLATALTSAKSGDSWIGATRGGGTFSCTPTTREIEVDGMRSAFVGSTINDGWEVKMSATLLEMTPANLQLALGSADITDDTSNKTHTIKLRTAFDEDDYIDTLTWVGDLADGGYVLIEIENALAVGGLSLTFSDKAEGELPIELTAHQESVDNQDNAPCTIIFFDPA